MSRGEAKAEAVIRSPSAWLEASRRVESIKLVEIPRPDQFA